MINVGQRAERRLTVTDDHVRKFAEISGDYNPLHFDGAFAAATKFGRLVAQGGLTTGLLHALVAMDLPGPGTVFLSQNWKFTAPVYIGDTITAQCAALGAPLGRHRLVRVDAGPELLAALRGTPIPLSTMGRGLDADPAAFLAAAAAGVHAEALLAR